jgi:hypothetical protein
MNFLLDAAPGAKMWFLQPVEYIEALHCFRLCTPEAYRPGTDFLFLLVHDYLSFNVCTPVPGEFSYLKMCGLQPKVSRPLPYEQYGWKRKYSYDHHGKEVIEWNGRCVWVPSSEGLEIYQNGEFVWVPSGDPKVYPNGRFSFVPFSDGCECNGNDRDTQRNRHRLLDDASYVRQLIEVDTSVTAAAAAAAAAADHRVANDGNLKLVHARDASFAAFAVMNERDSIDRRRHRPEHVLVTALDIDNARYKSFEDKVGWFHKKCRLFRVPYEEGHVRFHVGRDCLLEDSIDAIMRLSRLDLRKVWCVGFVEQSNCDEGTTGEWISLLAKEIFRPDLGLWKGSESHRRCLDFNTAAPSKRSRT